MLDGGAAVDQTADMTLDEQIASKTDVRPAQKLIGVNADRDWLVG